MNRLLPTGKAAAPSSGSSKASSTKMRAFSHSTSPSAQARSAWIGQAPGAASWPRGHHACDLL
eukprot:12895179-Prorocentrum_lima.AAC.1